MRAVRLCNALQSRWPAKLSGLSLLCCAAVWSAGTDPVFDDTRLHAGAKLAGSRAQHATERLLPLLRSARAQPPRDQLHAVNRFFNEQLRFAPDKEVWAVEDHWASPLQALQQGAGDCEDYAIAKYFSLLAAGMPAARLRLVYVRARLPDGSAQAHMVLAYHGGGDGDEAGVLILDNLIDEIEPASRRVDLSPVFSFNSEGLWEGVGPVAAGSPLLRLTRWRDVMARARAEGFP